MQTYTLYDILLQRLNSELRDLTQKKL